MRELLALAACAAFVTSCFPQGQCESTPSFVDYCGAASDPNCQGHIVDSTHWESGPMVGNWLVYGPEQTYLMTLRDKATGAILNGTLADVAVSISAVEQPNTPGNQGTVCAGNACEFSVNDAQSVYVKNDTCASYFVRVYVTMEPSAGDASTE